MPVTRLIGQQKQLPILSGSCRRLARFGAARGTPIWRRCAGIWLSAVIGEMTRRFANRGCRQPGSRQCEHLGFRQGPASRPGYPGWVTALVRVCSDDDFTAWVDITNTVVPNERTTVAKIRAAEEPGRLLLLAESRGVPVGCGIAAPSSFAGR